MRGVGCVHLSLHPTPACLWARLSVSSLAQPVSFYPSFSLSIIPHPAFISPLTGSNVLLPIAEYDFMLLVLNSKGGGGNTYISLFIKAINYITFTQVALILCNEQNYGSLYNIAPRCSRGSRAPGAGLAPTPAPAP